MKNISVCISITIITLSSLLCGCGSGSVDQKDPGINKDVVFYDVENTRDTTEIKDALQDVIVNDIITYDNINITDNNILDIADGEYTIIDVTNEDIVGDIVIEDGNADIIIEDVATTDVNADYGGGCEPVLCDLFCEYGFKKDENGCEVCVCAECKDNKDCYDKIDCQNPVCSKSGNCICECKEGEGVYEYQCPDGSTVRACDCNLLGIKCIENPEDLCPTICKPDSTEYFNCPDGNMSVEWCKCKRESNRPVCKNMGTSEEGWYDSSSGDLIRLEKCSNCYAFCEAIGSKGEGWYAHCSDDFSKSTLLKWEICSPQRNCIDNPVSECPIQECGADWGEYICKDGSTFNMCDCILKCEPYCDKIGTESEGWYDPCTGKVIKYAECKDCSIKCDKIGTKSEGWYSSCTGLVAWADCGSIEYSCLSEPWNSCPAPAECRKEGQGYSGDQSVCCAGLTAIDEVIWDGNSCLTMDCLCKVCTLCGDGICTPPENHCNCKEDCFYDIKHKGELCYSTFDCENDLVCLNATDGLYRTGVCSKVCVNESANPEEQCPKGFNCMIVPPYAASGYCLPDCRTQLDCSVTQRCGRIKDDEIGGCFFWSSCDPINDTGCGPEEQCRVVDDREYCSSPAGTLKEGEKCNPSDDICGSGLVCGKLNICLPICTDDTFCKNKKYDFCLKNSKISRYGQCMIYE